LEAQRDEVLRMVAAERAAMGESVQRGAAQGRQLKEEADRRMEAAVKVRLSH
jgi:hypothetical protein